jgi:phosphatidylserine/phosphatidylglycerophosphate/cardiolipin synthase-like enzyme
MGKSKSDADIKSLAAAENVTVKIASLKEHSSGFIPFARVQHSKYITADGKRSYISTSNWGPTYFTTSRGAAVVIYGAEGARVLEDVFGKIWNGKFVEPVDQDKTYSSVDRTGKNRK